VGALY